MTRSTPMPDLFFTLRYGEDAADPFRDDAWTAALVAGAERALTQLLARLGVPATPALALEASPDHEGLRLLLDDVRLTLPDGDIRRLEQLYPEADADDHGMALLVALITRTAEANAPRLVGDRQNLRWIAAALEQHPTAEPIARYAECTRAVLRALLGQGIAISDTSTICRYLLEGLKSRRRTAAMAESAIARLQPPALDLEIDPAYAARLFPGLRHEPVPVNELPEPQRNPFDMLRDGIFYELGVRLPPMRLVPSEELPAGAFRLRSGAVGWTPWLGLHPDRVLVNLPPEQAAATGITVAPVIFPSNDSIASAIPAEDGFAGTSSWSAVEYLVLAAARDVRDNPGVLLDIDAVESAVTQLEDAFPELVYAALEKISATDLTRVLRKLLSGDVSIRNFRSILERLLAYDWVCTDLSREILFDSRLPVDRRIDPLHEPDLVDRYVEYVRAGLQLFISHRALGPGGTLQVRLLDPDTIERPILEELSYRQAAGLGRPIGAARLEAIREAVRRESADRPVALLTIPPVASFLREELRGTLPRLPVLSYQELTWDVRVQPLDRISA